MGIERTGLDIIIRTPGAKESAEELKQLGQATDSFTNEAKKSSPVLDEVADKTEKTTIKKKDLKDSLKQLGHAIPGVHQAMLLLKNPIVILAGAISTLITAFRAYLQSVDELAQSVGIHEAVSKSVTLLGGAFRDAAEGLQQFTIELGEAAAKEKDLNTELEKNLKLIEEQTRRETELRDAKEALAIEKVNKAEKTGRLAPENAIEQRRIIRDQFAAQREAARRKAEDEAIEAKGETLTKVMESRLRAEVALPGALKEAAIAQRLADAAPKKQESDLESIGKEQKRWKEQREDALARRGGFQAGLLDTVAGVAPAGSAAAAGGAALREQQDALIDEATAAPD